MNRLVLVIVVVIALIAGYFIFQSNKTITNTLPQQNNLIAPDADNPTPEQTNFTARFEIYTNGTKRIFTDTKYHNLSPDVYITKNDPSIIYVKKAVTWGDFFQTLPMSLTKECLTTGTGQLFCTNENQKLQFIINHKEDPDALDRLINQNDKLQVVY